MTALPKSGPVAVLSGAGHPTPQGAAVTPNLNASERVGGPSGAVAPARRGGGGLIAAIHTLKSKLQLSDDDYRHIVRSVTGHSSSKDCTPAQRQQLRDHLQRQADRMLPPRSTAAPVALPPEGAAPALGRPGGGQGVASPQRRADFAAQYKAANPRERKVWAIWLDMARRGLVHNKSAQALDAFVCRQTGVTALRWCTAAQLDAVIEALKLWQKRGVEVR